MSSSNSSSPASPPPPQKKRMGIAKRCYLPGFFKPITRDLTLSERVAELEELFSRPLLPHLAYLDETCEGDTEDEYKKFVSYSGPTTSILLCILLYVIYFVFSIGGGVRRQEKNYGIYSGRGGKKNWLKMETHRLINRNEI